jgi:hypothetical protein
LARARRAEAGQLLLGGAAQLADHFARMGERFLHQRGIGHLLGNAAREQIRVASHASSAAFWLGAAT